MNTTDTNRIIFRQGPRVILRPVTEADLPTLVRYINDPETSQYLAQAFPMTIEQERAWFQSLTSTPRQDIVLAIETHEGKLLGVIGLHSISWIHRTATTGTVIGEATYRNQGYGTEAKMLLLEYAFHTLGLRKICSKVYSFNTRSQRYSEKCGYIVEGTLRKHVFRNGSYWDEIQLAVFQEDWESLWQTFCTHTTKSDMEITH